MQMKISIYAQWEHRKCSYHVICANYAQLPWALISTKIAINLPNGKGDRWPKVIIMHNIDNADSIAEECWCDFEMHFSFTFVRVSGY